MADVRNDPNTSHLVHCSARVVTTAATFVASVGVIVMGASGPSSASENASGSWLALIGVLLSAAVAWFASRLRYGAVMVACAVVGLIPWTRDWWQGDGGSVGGTGLGLVTLGVLLTSFVSANSRPALQSAWEQCAPASAAAAGWLLSLSLLLASVFHGWRWFGPVPLVLGALLFSVLALASAAAARERVSRGALPSPYMAGRSFRSVLLLKFFGGAGYVLVALSIILPSVVFIWLMTGGSMYQRSREWFMDGTHKMEVRPK